MPLSQTVTFVPPSTRSCFNISIVNDEVFEPTDTFAITIQPRDPRVVVSQGTFTVTIIDENGKTLLHFWISSLRISERKSGELELEGGSQLLHFLTWYTYILAMSIGILQRSHFQRGMDHLRETIVSNNKIIFSRSSVDQGIEVTCCHVIDSIPCRFDCWV